MAPMVVLGSQDALPGRYWGEGQGPIASPSQASILLARINSRARERKAGRLSVGQGEEEGLAEGLSTLKHTNLDVQNVTPRKEIKGQMEMTPKDQPVDAASPPIAKVEPRVNGVRTEEASSSDMETVKKKKRKKKDSEGEESKGVLETPEIPEALKEECAGAPVIKKKKRKKEGEESQIDEENSQSGIAETEKGEAELIKKKKKKRHKEIENKEESISVKTEEGYVIQTETENKPEEHVKINGDKVEDSSYLCENQKKKKKKNRGDEESEKTVSKEMEDTQTLNSSQQEEDIHSSSPRKKKKKDKKQELKEETLEKSKSSQDLSPLKVPKIEIKEEITDTLEDIQTGVRMEESHTDSHAGVNQEAERKDDKNAKMDKKKAKKQQKDKKKKNKKDKLKNREVGGFTLLTEVEATKRQKVQRTLPHWLANPTVIGRDLMADGAPVDSLPGLDASLVDTLKQQKIQQLFPVQRAVIPEILASAGPLSCRYRPRDVCVSAPTGSGKTLAYVLPLVQALKSRTVPRIRALVLLPVQELATQVYHVFQLYCKGTPLRVGKAVGHSTLQKEQVSLVVHHLGCHHSLVDILVATPGRLADHLRMTHGLDLSALRYLVLDEADRMLAAEGGDWVGHIQRAIVDHQAKQENQLLLQPSLQRLLFSATLSSDPEQLQHVTLHHPKLFTVAAPAAGQDKSMAVVMGQFVRPAELREEFVVVEEEVKPLALHHLLVSGEGRQRVLVFTNSVQATHKLALLLAALSEGSGRVVAEFSSKRDKRQQILSQFTAGKIDVLVSSDAMARGLDIPDIDHVVSYDVTAATTYVHRIGRTARAGRPGTALSLVTKTTLTEFRRALSGGGEGASQLALTPEELEPYEQQYIDSLATLKKTLEEEERQKRQNQTNGKAKKSKKKQKQRQRKQKKDKRAARLLSNKSEGKRKVTVNANRLQHH
uniref:ATP-dependent RNA helicase n=1 Tax=Scylla olivacea TaxID=85551 RepID=A0A0P4W536_SCYOL